MPAPLAQGSPPLKSDAGPPANLRPAGARANPATPGFWARHWSSAGALLIVTPLAAIDWLWPLHKSLSYLLTLAITLVMLPWAVALFRGAPEEVGLGQLELPQKQRAWRGRLAHLATLGLMLALLTAKWLVLLNARTTPSDFEASSRSYMLAVYLVFVFGLVARGLRLSRFFRLVADHPARLMALSFGLTGVLGALLLSLPFSLETLRGVSLVDHLFMAFSAVCVTGLSVNNVAQTYSAAGQAILCALIQVGGLGIMVLSAAITLLVGQRLRVKSSAVLAEMVDVTSLASLKRTILMILFFTVLFEGSGALVLYYVFQAHPDAVQGDVRWAAVFHAVSAFCNAGFSTFTDNLVPFCSSPALVLCVTLLIVLGGIGFPVLDELGRALVARLRGQRLPKLSLHTQIALRTTAVLLGGMTLTYLVLEWRASMAELSLGERLLASIFQSASARTAGFNVVNMGLMTSATLLVTCAAMFVGACPGGTGGGIKTTTLAALHSGLGAELMGRSPRLLDRAIPQPVIRRAIGVAFLSMTLVFVVLFLLLLIEPHPPLELAFETVSAFSTTGLSTGITPNLTPAGKLLITVTMLVGRIGPLTMALALARSTKQPALALPEERLMIG